MKESTQVRNTTRAAGTALAVAAGIMALGAPAFASEHHHATDTDVHHNHTYNGISALNENNIQVPIGVCNNNVGALIGAAVPILSPQTVGHCSTAVIDQH